MLDYAVAFTNFSGAFPNISAVNASGPSATDGTEFIANMINDSMWGTNQMILNHAGLSPNGVLESDSASQIKEALWKGFGGFPGEVKEWHLSNDPGTTGHRCLFLNGQGILIASYPTLDDGSVGGPQGVYVGDANNAAVAAGGGFYYRASDAAGTTPDIAGPYLILPETRGYGSRVLDTAASVDPDGASRFLGDVQVDAMQRTTGGLGDIAITQVAGPVTGVFSGSASGPANAPNLGVVGRLQSVNFNNANSTSPNAAKTDDSETRTTNYSTKKVVWY